MLKIKERRRHVMSINKVIIIGHLGSDPELRHTTSGHSVTRFNVATNEYWKSKTGEQNEKTEWHRIIAWGRLGEICHQHLSKGRQVYLEGRLQTRSWEDSQNVKKYSTEIIASTVQFLGGPSEHKSSSVSPTTSQLSQNNQNNSGNTSSYEEKPYVEEPHFDPPQQQTTTPPAPATNTGVNNGKGAEASDQMPF